MPERMIIVNRCCFIGRITSDPRVSQSKFGKILSFTLAVDAPAVNGESKADFIRHSVYGKMADEWEGKLVKGQRICTEGRLSVRTVDGKDGNKVNYTDIRTERIHSLENNQAKQEAPW
jgi:single stranded DNA-binding protein